MQVESQGGKLKIITYRISWASYTTFETWLKIEQLKLQQLGLSLKLIKQLITNKSKLQNKNKSVENKIAE